jgi:cytoskeletal protein CcmA (bactofilin family)
MHSVYVDGELDAGERRGLEKHLRRCRACRTVVAALEEEGTALRSALRLEELAPAAAASARDPRGIAVGVVAALATALVCAEALSRLGELQAPAAAQWLSSLLVPLDWTRVFSAPFDALPLLRGETPLALQRWILFAGLLALVFVVSTSSALARRRYLGARTTAALLLAGVFALFSAPTPALAFEVQFGGEEVSIPAGEVVEQTWVTSAKSVTIDGTLRGDLVAAGERVIISGTVEGNVLSAARRVEILGHVTGSVIAFGERVHVGGQIDRNAYVATERIRLTESGQIGRDLLAAGRGGEITGRVGRDARTFVEWLEVRGAVERDLSARAERVELLSGARVGGNLHVATLGKEPALEVDPSAVVEGETTTELLEEEVEDPLAKFTSPQAWFFQAISFAAAFLAGMVLFRLAPWVFASEIRNGADFGRALGYGFATLVAAPIAIAVLALSIIGIPVAIIAGVVLVTCAYFAQIVVAGIIGRAIFDESEEQDWSGFGFPLVAGLSIVFAVTYAPYLGGVVGFVVLVVGLGAITQRMRVRFHI